MAKRRSREGSGQTEILPRKRSKRALKPTQRLISEEDVTPGPSTGSPGAAAAAPATPAAKRSAAPAPARAPGPRATGPRAADSSSTETTAAEQHSSSNSSSSGSSSSSSSSSGSSSTEAAAPEMKTKSVIMSALSMLALFNAAAYVMETQRANMHSVSSFTDLREDRHLDYNIWVSVWHKAAWQNSFDQFLDTKAQFLLQSVGQRTVIYETLRNGGTVVTIEPPSSKSNYTCSLSFICVLYTISVSMEIHGKTYMYMWIWWFMSLTHLFSDCVGPGIIFIMLAEVLRIVFFLCKEADEDTEAQQKPEEHTDTIYQIQGDQVVQAHAKIHKLGPTINLMRNLEIVLLTQVCAETSNIFFAVIKQGRVEDTDVFIVEFFIWCCAGVLWLMEWYNSEFMMHLEIEFWVNCTIHFMGFVLSSVVLHTTLSHLIVTSFAPKDVYDVLVGRFWDHDKVLQDTKHQWDAAGQQTTELMTEIWESLDWYFFGLIGGIVVVLVFFGGASYAKKLAYQSTRKQNSHLVYIFTSIDRAVSFFGEEVLKPETKNHAIYSTYFVWCIRMTLYSLYISASSPLFLFFNQGRFPCLVLCLFVIFVVCWCYQRNEVTRVSDESIEKHLRNNTQKYKTYTARPDHSRQMSACVLLVYWLVLAYCVAAIIMKLFAFLMQPTYNDSQKHTVSELLWDNLQLDHLEKYIVFILFGLVCIINWNAESHSEYQVTETKEASGNQQISVAQISSLTAFLIFRDVADVDDTSFHSVGNSDELERRLAFRNTISKVHSNIQSNPASSSPQPSMPNVFDTVTQDSIVILMKTAGQCRHIVQSTEGFLALKVYANAKANSTVNPRPVDIFRKLHSTMCLNHPRAFLRDSGRSRTESPLLKKSRNHCEDIQAYVFLTLMVVFEQVLTQSGINSDTKEEYVGKMTSIVQKTDFFLANTSNVQRLPFLMTKEKEAQYALNVLCALWGHVFQCHSEVVLVVLKLSSVKDTIKAPIQTGMESLNFPTTANMETYVEALKQWLQKNADESEKKIVEGLIHGKQRAPITVYDDGINPAPMYDTTLPATSGGTGLVQAEQSGR